LDLAPDDQGFNSAMLFTERATGYVFDTYLSSRKTPSVMEAVNYFLAVMERQFDLKPSVIECDNELIKSKAMRLFRRSKGIRIEPCAPNTQAQNGGAERAGGVIKIQARAMRAAARLPQVLLWVEIYRATVYLNNCTPKRRLGWRSPYELFHGFLTERNGIPNPDRKPHLAHLRNYGARHMS
jgi:hypothetical protein